MRCGTRSAHSAYDPLLSEADHNHGRLPEALRRQPGALRSRHPDASFAALRLSPLRQGNSTSTITADGERVWRRFRDIDSENGAVGYSPVVPEEQDSCEVIARDMLAAGHGRQGQVGAGTGCLFEAADVVDSGAERIESKLARPGGAG